jgi:hypothetical protein
MATNPYFKNYSGEQDVVEELTIEIIKTMGKDMLYIPRNKFNEDELFGEQRGNYYSYGVPVEMYIDSVGGFEGQGDIATRFGIEIRDNVTLTLARKRFTQEVQARFPEITRPREGDIIFFPLARALFEINFVEHENPFYQLGKLFSYRLTCELYNYNQEAFTTGNTDVDAVVQEHDTFDLTHENTAIDDLGKDVIDFTDIDPFSEGNY